MNLENLYFIVGIIIGLVILWALDGIILKFYATILVLVMFTLMYILIQNGVKFQARVQGD